MRKLLSLSTVAAFVMAGSAFACEKDAKLATDKQSGCSKSARTVAAKTGCHKTADGAVAKVMKDLPYMTYRVGDFETCCAEAAAAKAGENGKIQYKIADKSFDCRGKAMERLATLLEARAEEMMAVSYSVDGECYSCPVTAKGVAAEKGSKVKFRLAGFDFATRDEADAVAGQVAGAVAKLAATKSSTNTEPGCSKPCGQAQTASGKSGCGKGNAASTASAKSGCGSKSDASTASAKGGCCSKSKATTAAAKGGCGSKSKAATASAKSGCGSKSKAATGSAKSGCGSKSKAATASAKASCSKTGSDACCKTAEARVAAAKAKVQAIVETAQAAQTS